MCTYIYTHTHIAPYPDQQEIKSTINQSINQSICLPETSTDDEPDSPLASPAYEPAGTRILQRRSFQQAHFSFYLKGRDQKSSHASNRTKKQRNKQTRAHQNAQTESKQKTLTKSTNKKRQVHTATMALRGKLASRLAAYQAAVKRPRRS